MSLASCKYWIAGKNADFLLNFGYEPVKNFNNIFLYRNKFSLPLGITYNQVLDEGTFKKISAVKKDDYLLTGCVVADQDKDLMAGFKKYNIADTAEPFAFEKSTQHLLDLRKDTLNITSFKESHIKGEINLTEPKILFLSIPFDEGWSVKVNGATSKLFCINCGLTGVKLPAGKSTVDLQFEPRYMKQGGMVSLAGILVFVGLLSVSKLKKGSGAA